MEPAKDFDLGTIGIGNLRAEAVDDGMLGEEVIARVETWKRKETKLENKPLETRAGIFESKFARPGETRKACKRSRPVIE